MGHEHLMSEIVHNVVKSLLSEVNWYLDIVFNCEKRKIFWKIINLKKEINGRKRKLGKMEEKYKGRIIP